jgi:hypothetical protein
MTSRPSASAGSGRFGNQPKEIAVMKNSLDKQAFKFGIVAVILAGIIPVLAQQMLSGPAAAVAVAAATGVRIAA